MTACSSGSVRRFTRVERTFRIAKLRTVALVAYKAAADVGAKVAMFAIAVLAARRLSPWDFGVFSLGTTVGWLLSIATDFGVQLHVARAVAHSPHEAPLLLRQWGRFRIGATGVGLGAFVVGLAVIRPGAEQAVPLLLFAAAYSATSLVDFLNYFYRGLSRTDIESTLTICQRAATLAGAVGVLVWWPSPTALALAMLVPAVAALAWSTGRATSTVPAAAPAMPAAAPFASFFDDVFPIGLGIVLSALYFRIDILMLQSWSGTEAVGRYNAVFRPIEALRLFPAAVLAVMLPALSRARDGWPVAGVAAAVTAFAVFLASVLSAAGDRVLLLLYGSAYRAALPAFRILTLTLPLLSMNYALTHQLIAWDRQRAYAVVCAAALLFNVALNAWLIPSYSIEGAAWATFGTEVVLTSGCLVALRTRS